MPGLHQPVPRALRGDGEPVKLTRQPHGEIADVDHLLNLAFALGENLAGLDRDEAAERLFGSAQLSPEEPHELASPRRRHRTPFTETGFGASDFCADAGRIVSASLPQNRAVDGRGDGDCALCKCRGRDTERREQRSSFRHGANSVGVRALPRVLTLYVGCQPVDLGQLGGAVPCLDVVQRGGMLNRIALSTSGRSTSCSLYGRNRRKAAPVGLAGG